MNGEEELPTEPDVRSDLLRAIEAVILELANILSDYRDAFVVSGGLALHLLYPTRAPQHSTGITSSAEEEPYERLTKDVDLILNVLLLEEMFDDRMQAIGELLMENHYQLQPRKHYWIRAVNLPGFVKQVEVPVEFLAPSRFASGSADSEVLAHLSALQEITPAPLYGIDLVLLQPQMVTLSGLTPTRERLDNIPVQVVDLAMLILVKAIAFQDRLNKHVGNPEGERHLLQAAKHAYDISECLRRYPGGMEVLAERISPLWLMQGGTEQAQIDDALECLRVHFTSPTDKGPSLMVREERYQLESENERMVARRQVSRRVERLLRLLEERMKPLL